jgi:hypothetical protein
MECEEAKLIIEFVRQVVKEEIEKYDQERKESFRRIVENMGSRIPRTFNDDSNVTIDHGSNE